VGKSLTPNMLMEFKRQLATTENIDHDAIDKITARISIDRLTEYDDDDLN